MRQALLPVFGIQPPLVCSASVSPARARVATSASSPSMMERACPEPPWLCLMVTSWPVLAFQCFGKGLVELHVQLAGRVVRR